MKDIFIYLLKMLGTPEIMLCTYHHPIYSLQQTGYRPSQPSILRVKTSCTSIIASCCASLHFFITASCKEQWSGGAGSNIPFLVGNDIYTVYLLPEKYTVLKWYQWSSFKLILMSHTDELDPYESYGSIIRINMIRMTHTDQVHPYKSYRSTINSHTFNVK